MKNTGIVNVLGDLKIYLSTGQGWIADFKYPVLLMIALKVYLPNASNLLLGLIALGGMILMGLLGWFDLKYIKLVQTVADKMTRKYNPCLREMSKKIERLK